MATRTSLEFSITAAYEGAAAMAAARADFKKTRDELSAMAKEGVRLRVDLEGLEKDRAEILSLTGKVHDVNLHVVAKGTPEAERKISNVARTREAKIIVWANTSRAEQDIRDATRTRTGRVEFTGDASAASQEADRAARERRAPIRAEAEGAAEAAARLDAAAHPREAPIVARTRIDTDAQRQLNELRAAYERTVQAINATAARQVNEIRRKLANDKAAIPEAFGGRGNSPEARQAARSLTYEAAQEIASVREEAARQRAMAGDLARAGGIDIRSDARNAKGDVASRAAAENNVAREQERAVQQAARERGAAARQMMSGREKAAQQMARGREAVSTITLRAEAGEAKAAIAEATRRRTLEIDIDQKRAKDELEKAFPRKRSMEVRAIITRAKDDLGFAAREHKIDIGDRRAQASRDIDKALRVRDAAIAGGANRRETDELTSRKITEITARAKTDIAELQLEHAARARNSIITAQADVSEAKRRLASIPVDKSGLNGLAAAADKAKAAVAGLASAMALVSVGAGALGALALTGLVGGIIVAGGAAIAINKRLTLSHNEAMAAAKMQAEAANRDVTEAYRNIATTAIESSQKMAAAQHDVSLAERDVADTAIESGQRIAAAQHDVAIADRSEEDARRSLTDAYRDARHELEDLQLQLEAAPFNERAAQIRLERAYQRLRELGSKKGVTAVDFEEAYNDIGLAQVGIDEVREHNRQLQEEAAVAAQRGVEGNEKVIKGKEGLADATYQAQIADKNLANTQRQTSEATADAAWRERIAKQDLANTQRETAAAQQKAAEQLQVALAEQTRAQTELEKATYAANSALSQMLAMFADLAAPLKGPLHDAMASLKQQFLDLKPVIQLGFQEAGKDVQPFTDALTGLLLGPVPGVTRALQNSHPAILGFRDGMRSLGLDIGTMFEKMSVGAEGFGNMWRGLGDQVGKFLIQIGTFAGQYAGPASQALIALLQGVNDLTSGFLGGLGPVMQDLPGIARGVSSVMKDIGQVLKDVEPPLGRLVKALVDGLAPVINTLSGPISKTFVDILNSLTGIVDGLAGPMNELAKALGTILRWLDPLIPLLTPLVVGFGAFRYIGGPIVSAFQAIQKEGWGVLGMFSNPWVVGLAVAAGAVMAFSETAGKGEAAVARIKNQAQQMIDANYAVKKAMESSGNPYSDSSISAETNKFNKHRQDLKDNANDAPGWTDKVVGGLARSFSLLSYDFSTNTPGRGEGLANGVVKRDNDSADAKRGLGALNSLNLSDEQIVKIYTGPHEQFAAYLKQLKDMGDNGKAAAGELTTLRSEFSQNAQSITPLTAAMKDLADRNKDASSAIDAATNALERQRQGGLTLEDAQKRANAAILSLATSTDTAKGAMVDANGTINTTTQQGQALYGLINQQLAPAWEQLTSAAFRNAQQNGQTGDQAVAAAQRASDGVKNSALAQIEAMGFTQEQAQRLLDHYIQLSGNFDATFSLKVDAKQANDELDTFLKTWGARWANGPLGSGGGQLGVTSGAPDSGQLGVTSGAPAAPPKMGPPLPAPPKVQGPPLPGHAFGGLISGPGTDTSDSILSLLSRDEFVARAAAVRKYGVGFFQALNAGVIDPGALPGFANGGSVGGAASLFGIGSGNAGFGNLVQGSVDALVRTLPVEFQKMYDTIENGTTKAQNTIGTSWADSTNEWKDTVGNKFTGDTQKLWEKFWNDSANTAKVEQSKIGTDWTGSIQQWNTLVNDKIVGDIGTEWNEFWDQTGDTAKTQQDKITTGFHDNFATGLKNSTTGLVSDVNTEWSKIEGVFAKPVNTIIGMWNQNVVGAVPGLQQMNPIPGYANGGQPDGSPGYINGMGGSREDRHIVAVSNREYIVNAEATRRNRAVLDAINFGGERAAIPAYGLGGMTESHAPEIPGFGLGGIAMRHMRKAAGFRFADGGAVDGSSQAAITRALSWAASLSGQPYNYQGWLDCSGFISGVYDSLLGRTPHREFTTVSDFAALGFVPGRGGIMDIGVTPLPGNAGHMAATLAGHRLESGGPHDNIMVDGSAVGADSGQFSDHYYLPGQLFNPPYAGAGSDGQAGRSGSFVGMLGGAVTAIGGGVQNLVSDLFRNMTDPVLAGIPDVQGPGGFPKAMATKVRDALIGGIKGQETNMLIGGEVPQGLHKQIIDQALALTNTPPPGSIDEWERGLETLVTRESGWNTASINDWDSNAVAGNPSKGLAQTTGTTFEAFKVPGHGNIYEGVDNVAAAINYIKSRYGSISNVQQANANMPAKGYAEGTNNAQKGWAWVGEKGVELVNFNGGEQVIPNDVLKQSQFGPNQQQAATPPANPNPFDLAQMGPAFQAQAGAAGLNFLKSTGEEAFHDVTGLSLFNGQGFISQLFRQVPAYALSVMQWQQSGQLGKPYSVLQNQLGSQLAAPPKNPLDPGQEGVPAYPQGQGPSTANPATPGQLQGDLAGAPQNPNDPGQQGVPTAPQNQPPSSVDPLNPMLRPVELHFHVTDVQDAIKQWTQHQREQSLGFDPFGGM